MRRPSPGILAAVILTGLSILAVTFLVQAWSHIEAQMSIHGWIALILGVVVTMAFGVGLMALVFFSARRGWDDTVDRNDRDEAP
jgi:heme/copper-type cytochrome/quinol oxidase subunit 2